MVLFHGAGLGLVAAGLGGCGLLDRKPKPPPAPDALEPLRAQAQALADRYDATIAAVPNLATRLTPLRDAHRAHVVELGKAIGTATPSAQAAASASAGASGSPPPADPQAAVAALRTAEEAAQPDAVAACLAAPAKRAGLVAAIAACRATHVEALR